MDVTQIARMSTDLSTQQLQYAASAKVQKAVSGSMLKESAAIAENTMGTLFEGLEDTLAGLGLGENVDLMA